MSLANPTIDEQIAINSAMWFNASPSGQIYLHNQNVALQDQKDQQNKTITVYQPATGTYQTSAVVPVKTIQDQPNIPVVTSYPVQATTASNAVVATPQLSQVDKRRMEAGAFTGWDNDPTLRSMQVKDWDIYIATGRWDSPEQIQIHNEAETARKAINVTYKGAINGTTNKAMADALILPDNQPNVSSVSNSITGAIKSLVTGATGATGAQTGGLIKAGLGVGAVLFVMSLFKGGRH